MRRLLAATLVASTWALGVGFGSIALADAPDPTVHQIYEAAEAGHYDQAQQMLDQVLRDHPQSAKAHYVQAELYAKEGMTSQARAQLSQAEGIDPGLTHENARSVQELKAQLAGGSSSGYAGHYAGGAVAPRAHFPWGMVLIFGVALIALYLLFRRRPTYAQYPAGVAPMGGGGPGYAPGYGPGYAGPGPMGGGGGGIGSGIAGGLASGLAVGAGVVAGEEIAHHFMDGGANREGYVAPPADSGGWDQSNGGNTDMGGTDFGVNDAGSWDDSGGGGGGGGDDWS